MKLSIQLFGSLKEVLPEPMLTMEIPESIKVKEAKVLICEEIKKRSPMFQKQALILDSALATDTEIFQDEMALPLSQSYSLLPPVCGG